MTLDAHALIDALAPALGLAITADQRPGVVQFLGVAAAMAAILDQAPIETADLAPVFHPRALP